MLSESCLDALMVLIHEKDVTIGTKTFQPRSIRNMEMVNAADAQNEKAATVVLTHVGTNPKKRVMSDLCAHDDTTGVETFGLQEVSEVVLSVSAKELRKGDDIVNPKDVTHAIMSNIDSIVKKKWNFTLALYNASIDMSKSFVYKDFTPFVQGDGRSKREMRIWIEHDTTWDLTDTGVTSFGPDTRQINFQMEGDEEYTIVQEE